MTKNTTNQTLFKKPTNPWIIEHVFSQLNPVTLLCFPYAGGNTLAFSSWSHFLPSGCNLLAIQYPGRLGLISLPPEKQIRELVKKIYEHIVPYLGNDKIIFFGHSLGALVSFEFANYAEKMGHRPIDGLFVSACVSPELVEKKGGIHHLSDDDFLERIRGYGGTPSELFENKELMNFFVPVLKSDFCMYENYRQAVGETINCPVIAMGSSEDPYAPVELMRNWSSVTSQRSSLVPVTGGHFYIHDNQSNFPEIFQKHLSTIIFKEDEYGK